MNLEVYKSFQEMQEVTVKLDIEAGPMVETEYATWWWSESSEAQKAYYGMDKPVASPIFCAPWNKAQEAAAACGAWMLGVADEHKFNYLYLWSHEGRGPGCWGSYGAFRKDPLHPEAKEIFDLMERYAITRA